MITSPNTENNIHLQQYFIESLIIYRKEVCETRYQYFDILYIEM